MPNTATRVLAFGTFDLLHPGHLSFLRQARRLGTELIVVVARDANAEKLKGRRPIQDETTRLAQVSRLPFVTQAMLGQEKLEHRFGLIKQLQPDVIALGYDQFLMTMKLERDLKTLGLHTTIVRCRAFRPDLYKSNLLRPKV